MSNGSETGADSLALFNRCQILQTNLIHRILYRKIVYNPGFSPPCGEQRPSRLKRRIPIDMVSEQVPKMTARIQQSKAILLTNIRDIPNKVVVLLSKRPKTLTLFPILPTGKIGFQKERIAYFKQRLYFRSLVGYTAAFLGETVDG